MKLLKFECRHLELPLNYKFSHSSATRTTGDSILIKLSTQNDFGHGEGCPRSYVTDETYESSLQFLSGLEKKLLNLNSIDDLKGFTMSNEIIIDKNPAAWCAFEMAFLDILGKVEKKNLENLLNYLPIITPVKFTAVIGVSKIESQIAMIVKYRELEFDDLKIKFSGELSSDLKLINYLKKMNSPFLRVRADANNLWDTAEEVISYLKELDYKFFAIEEPLKCKNISILSKLSKSITCPIILDESFIKKSQFEKIQPNDNFIINLRISKMGGMIRSYEVAKIAKDKSIPLILGCQVAETSLLTRSALSIGELFKDNIVAREGAFGEFLLEKDITNTPVQWNHKALVAPEKYNNFKSSGLGLEIDKKLFD